MQILQLHMQFFMIFKKYLYMYLRTTNWLNWAIFSMSM